MGAEGRNPEETRRVDRVRSVSRLCPAPSPLPALSSDRSPNLADSIPAFLRLLSAPPAHSHQATHSSLLFPSTTPSFSSLLTNTISFPSFPSVSTLVPAPSTFSSFSSSLSPFTFPLHRVRCWFGLATAITEADGLTKTDEQIFVWYRVATGAAAKGRERAEGDA